MSDSLCALCQRYRSCPHICSAGSQCTYCARFPSMKLDLFQVLTCKSIFPSGHEANLHVFWRLCENNPYAGVQRQYFFYSFLSFPRLMHSGMQTAPWIMCLGQVFVPTLTRHRQVTSDDTGVSSFPPAPRFLSSTSIVRSNYQAGK